MNQGPPTTTGAVTRLIQELNKLPGIGPKSAQRLAYYLMRAPEEESRLLTNAILAVKQEIRLCSTCFNVTDTDPCLLCRNEERDRSKICIIEQPQDILAMEHTRVYHGLYHVLHGAISPTEGVGADSIRIKELLERLKNNQVDEVILATNSNNLSPSGKASGPTSLTISSSLASSCRSLRAVALASAHSGLTSAHHPLTAST